MIAITDSMSGADVADAVEQAAIQRGLTIGQFARPLSAHPTRWLYQLRQAQRPKPPTLERVKALLEGREVPPPPPNSFQAGGQRKPETYRAAGAGIPAEQLPPRVDREPCPRCGVRSDIGCHHSWRPNRNG
jgi:hypothetical protein